MQIILPLLIFSILTVILFGLGYWLTRSGFLGIKSARASLAWPSTPGKVVLIEVIKEKPSGTFVGNSGPRQTNYRPMVQVSYSIDGISYDCQRRRFNDNVVVYSTPQKAKTAIAAYQVGQTVQVYYDPQKPRSSVLEPGKAGPAWREFSSGILCFIFGLIPVAMAVAFLRN